MSELRIGIIGCGAIGTEHIRRINNRLTGGRVVAVMDINAASAQAAAQAFGAKRCETQEQLIASDEVDAVAVCSLGPAHEEAVLASIAAGKPCFCEKPLAETAQGCKRIVEAELKTGRHLVQVGFMRRYDVGYRRMREWLDSGRMGRPILVHCVHRNPEKDDTFTTPMMITDSAIHEIDVVHWLVDDTFVSAQVILPRSTRYAKGALRDPQLVILRTAGDIVVEIEAGVNSKYGYDVQCEVVCDEGTVALPDPPDIAFRREAVRGTPLQTRWADRFVDAYDIELQDWLDSTLRGEVNGPTAWDGYLAAVTADTCLRAQKTGAIEVVPVEQRPAFYDG